MSLMFLILLILLAAQDPDSALSENFFGNLDILRVKCFQGKLKSTFIMHLCTLGRLVESEKTGFQSLFKGIKPGICVD